MCQESFNQVSNLRMILCYPNKKLECICYKSMNFTIKIHIFNTALSFKKKNNDDINYIIIILLCQDYGPE